MNLGFIGAGNLAWHLAPALENTGHKVKAIYSLNAKSLEQLSGRLYDPAIQNNLDFTGKNLHLIFITTPDSEIQAVASEIVLPDECMLVHCSGSQGMEILERAACNDYGVFYPLQTFTKGYKTELSEVPFFIEGINENSTAILTELAGTLSKQVYIRDSLARRKIHLAAVFAGNFTNHFLTIAEGLLTDNKLDLDILWPVIKGTIQKSMEIGPLNAQTGPARRQDFDTMDAHLDLLKEDPDLEDIYNLISKHIIKTHCD
jgi:predicted short-subunit dehydrogenase-like oxidoreductase (DUF2520 family)